MAFTVRADGGASSYSSTSDCQRTIRYNTSLRPEAAFFEPAWNILSSAILTERSLDQDTHAGSFRPGVWPSFDRPVGARPYAYSFP